MAKELAAKERRTAGAVISDLARRGFHARTRNHSAKNRPQPHQRNGVRMLPKRTQPVTLAHVQKMMDEKGL